MTNAEQTVFSDEEKRIYLEWCINITYLPINLEAALFWPRINSITIF